MSEWIFQVHGIAKIHSSRLVSLLLQTWDESEHDLECAETSKIGTSTRVERERMSQTDIEMKEIAGSVVDTTVGDEYNDSIQYTLSVTHQ